MSGYSGYIRIRRVYKILAAAVGASFVTLCLAAALIPFSETVILRGWVADSTVELRAPRSGAIEQVHHRELDVVTSDSVFVTLNVGETVLYEKSRHQENLRLLTDRIEQKKAQLSSHTERDALRRQLHQELLRHNAGEFAIEQERLAILASIQSHQQSLIDDVSKLADRRYLSAREASELKSDLLNTSLRIRDARAHLYKLQASRERLEREEQAAAVEAEIAASGYRDEILGLEQELLYTQSAHALDLPAMIEGEVSRVYVDPGDYVKQGDILGTVRPVDNIFELHLAAPSSQIGKIEEGQEVRIKYDAYPFADYGIYHGTVTQVGKEANVALEGSPHTPASPSFLVKVALAKPYVTYGTRNFSIISGSTAEAVIKIKEKTVATWLFSSLLSFFQR